MRYDSQSPRPISRRDLARCPGKATNGSVRLTHLIAPFDRPTQEAVKRLVKVPKMPPYREVFLPIFQLGLLVAGTLALIVGVKSGCLVAGLLLIGRTLAVWAAMFFRSSMRYRMHTRDPPTEAYSDASVLGTLRDYATCWDVHAI